MFPVSEKASDVTRALERALREAGVQVRLNTRVEALAPLLERGPVVLATGGASYPVTGSTGDGYRLAAAVGHTVRPARPSLIPLVTREDWPKELQGLSLRNVRLSAKAGKKVRFDELGEMLFTHFGVSGPLVLSMSSHILDDDLDGLTVRLDMKPGLTAEQLARRVQRDLDEDSRKQVGTLLPQLVPARMAPVIARLAGIEAEKAANQVTKAERAALVDVLKAVPLGIAGYRPLEEAVITRGGVDVKEIDPKTMASKVCEGLYLAGEVIDVDAHTGGYNLQIAFSTGALAGAGAGGL